PTLRIKSTVHHEGTSRNAKPSVMPKKTEKTTSPSKPIIPPRSIPANAPNIAFLLCIRAAPRIVPQITTLPGKMTGSPTMKSYSSLEANLPKHQPQIAHDVDQHAMDRASRTFVAVTTN